jgi:DUF1365 family protein
MMVNWFFYTFMLLLYFVVVFSVLLIICVITVILKFWYREYSKILEESCFYYGEVKHTRLKGDTYHHFKYPIFFACLDLTEMEMLGNSLWPLFGVNSPYSSFCSFDHKQHLKDYTPVSASASTKVVEELNQSFLEKVKEFIYAKSSEKLKKEDISQVKLLTHLTYFGYCFNPISIYYLYLKSPSSSSESSFPHAVSSVCSVSSSFDSVIVEVSNTPWIEMHTYLLHTTVPEVEIHRKLHSSISSVTSCASERRQTLLATSSGSSSVDSSCSVSIEAKWKKAFHVSPFMEMDYLYHFSFFEPNDTLVCHAKMIKVSTNETWFTASFDLKRLPFTPRNILYVLVFYPFYTRTLQLLIHWEALKLWWKGQTFYNHPQGTDMNLGFGITGERITMVLGCCVRPFLFIYSLFSKHTIKEKHL